MSVYQTQGKPLSQQALYQQKLRQGYYNSPGKPSVGVASSASDTAALLAASTDLTVKPSYERLRAAPEAHNAATSVRLDRSKDVPAEPVANPSLGVPSSYDHGPVYRQAHSNSTSTMTSRTTPEKSVAKHGLASKPSVASTLNIGKISQLADKNSSSLINKRFNPDQDHRSGIAPKPAQFLTQEEESFAAQSAGRSLTMKHGSGYTDSISTQKRTKTFQAADVVDASLLAAASAKAQERLSSINAIHQSDLRDQAQLYSKALAAAQKNSEERLKSHNNGMVDLGGGLHLPSSEVDRLANLIVQPVLKDINTKAAAQREFDEAQQNKQTELKTLHAKAKKEEEARKHAAKIQRLKEKDQRVLANEDKKKAEDQKFSEHQNEQNTIVDGKTQELRDLQAKYADEKEALLKEKKENEDRISEEEGGLIKGRKEELDTMQKEKDAILKPTLDELKIETDKLKGLTDTKDQLTSEVRSGEKSKADYEAKIKELKEKLESTKAKIESTTSEHKEFVVKHEATDKEVKELKESSEKALKDVEASHKELDGEIEALNKEKKENIATKASHKKDIQQQIDEKVKGEYEINKQLPEHLQETIDEDDLRDTGSLFTVDEKKEVKKEVAKPQPKEAPKEAAKPQPKEASKEASKEATKEASKEATKEATKEQPKADLKEEKPSEKKESLPVKKEVAKPKKAEPVPDASPKKKGFRARLKGAFLGSSPSSSTSKPDSKTASKEKTDIKKDVKAETKDFKEEAKAENKSFKEEVKAEAKDVKKDLKDKQESISTSHFGDEPSIHENGKKTGFFKEEI